MLYVLFGGMAVAVAGVVYAFDPATARFYPPCAFHALTGLQCPGCGGTRALHQLLHGNFGNAVRLNPMLFVLLGLSPLVIVRPSILTKAWMAWTLAAVMLAWGVVRNLI